MLTDRLGGILGSVAKFEKSINRLVNEEQWLGVKLLLPIWYIMV